MVEQKPAIALEIGVVGTDVRRAAKHRKAYGEMKQGPCASSMLDLSQGVRGEQTASSLLTTDRLVVLNIRKLPVCRVSWQTENAGP